MLCNVLMDVLVLNSTFRLNIRMSYDIKMITEHFFGLPDLSLGSLECHIIKSCRVYYCRGSHE